MRILLEDKKEDSKIVYVSDYKIFVFERNSHDTLNSSS